MIIGILGKKRHGKDTIADYMVYEYEYKKMSFADPLKEALKILFDFSYEQLYGNEKEVIDDRWNISPRVAMQYIGTEFFRKDINNIIPGIDNNFWVNRMKISSSNILEEDNNIKLVMADTRFQNEVDAIHELGGKVIKVCRSNLEIPDNHISEDIDCITDYDYLINNDETLKDLYRKVDILLNKI